MRNAIVIFLLVAASERARAGELDLGVGVGATTTQWSGDRGGGPTIDASWWFTDWLAATYAGKEQYASVDERMLSYFSVGMSARRGPVVGSLGLVHQHEEPWPSVEDMPVGSVFGAGDGIRHRFGGRAAVHWILPFRAHAHGDFFASIDLDGAYFADDHGPAWMASLGASIGFSYDFARGSR
ncbi:MAG TPA: hypothetical protein VL463_19815 [Kofleriaceae bacterium]|nr:hypothetical protein [Kofleriaceae bacterium]